MASCTAERSAIYSLSNSSIANSPPSASTKAPAARLRLPYRSTVTAAVKPAPDAPLPDAESAWNDVFIAERNNYDFPHPGAPINKMFMSPLVRVPAFRRGYPPSCYKTSAFLIVWCP